MSGPIEIDCVQGGSEWVGCRLGIPTASRFSDIVTPGGKLSASREGYLGELLAEWVLNAPVSEFYGTFATERGQALEPMAFAAYAFARDAEPRKTGFVYRDDGRMVGCSPDALVGEDGVLELKCPETPGKHLVWYFRGGLPREHFAQTQGELWCTGRKWLDFMSFYPQLPPLIVRVEPDKDFHAALDKHLPDFIAEIVEAREKLAEFRLEHAPKRERPVSLLGF